MNAYFAFVTLGTCPNGTESVGCGPQEEFRACSDITITNADGTADETPNALVIFVLQILVKQAMISLQGMAEF